MLAILGPTMMVEADLRLKNNIPIMAHDAGDDNNLTFAQWIEEIIKVRIFTFCHMYHLSELWHQNRS